MPKGPRGKNRIVNAVGLGALIALASAAGDQLFGYWGLFAVIAFGGAFARSIWEKIYAERS